MMLIFVIVLACSSYSEVKKEAEELRENLKEIESGSVESEEEQNNGTETGLSKEAEYILSISNLLKRVGDHLILIGEVINDYNYGDIILEELKAYIGDFIMMFNESYYPEYLELEPPIRYEENYKDIGKAMEHIGKSTEYFQGFIVGNDEEEMLDSLDKALMEIEQSSEWMNIVQNN